MNVLPMFVAFLCVSGVALAHANGAGRARRAEAALRRVVEAQALAMWANGCATQDIYERMANDRDDAIEAAAALVESSR